MRVRYNNIDTSQHQNFQRFRNEQKNESSFVINSKMFEHVRCWSAERCRLRAMLVPFTYIDCVPHTAAFC